MRELERRINNLIQVGTVTETRCSDGKALARVNVLGRVTDFLPVKMIGNDFIRIWIPVRVGEQVMVVCPYGNANSGFIIPSIFNRNLPEPSGATEDKAIVEFAGGVRIDSDGSNVNIKAPLNVNIVCATATITAAKTIITSTTTNNGNVTINGNLDINGNLSMNGSGGSGKATITGDLNVSGVIYDSKGDLTNHTHSTTDGATAEAR